MEKNFVAIFDACVLFPATLRDLLIEFAGRAFRQKIFRAKWTSEIHEEWICNVLQKRPDLSRSTLERTRFLVDKNVPECLVTGYEHRMASIKLPDQDDRHVLVAAIECSARVIVTFNLDDFPSDELVKVSVVAKHPDDFIIELLSNFDDIGKQLLIDSTKAVQARLINPQIGRNDYFGMLERNGLVETVRFLRSWYQDYCSSV